MSKLKVKIPNRFSGSTNKSEAKEDGPEPLSTIKEVNENAESFIEKRFSRRTVIMLGVFAVSIMVSFTGLVLLILWVAGLAFHGHATVSTTAPTSVIKSASLTQLLSSETNQWIPVFDLQFVLDSTATNDTEIYYNIRTPSSIALTDPTRLTQNIIDSGRMQLNLTELLPSSIMNGLRDGEQLCVEFMDMNSAFLNAACLSSFRTVPWVRKEAFVIFSPSDVYQDMISGQSNASSSQGSVVSTSVFGQDLGIDSSPWSSTYFVANSDIRSFIIGSVHNDTQVSLRITSTEKTTSQEPLFWQWHKLSKMQMRITTSDLTVAPTTLTEWTDVQYDKAFYVQNGYMTWMSGSLNMSDLSLDPFCLIVKFTNDAGFENTIPCHSLISFLQSIPTLEYTSMYLASLDMSDDGNGSFYTIKLSMTQTDVAIDESTISLVIRYSYPIAKACADIQVDTDATSFHQFETFCVALECEYLLEYDPILIDGISPTLSSVIVEVTNSSGRKTTRCYDNVIQME